MPGLATNINGQPRDALEDMALRIARNREVFGLHYPSDSEAGRRLACRAHQLLAGCATYVALRNAAQAEWQGHVPL